MKRHSFAASLVLAVLAALGLAGPVAAGERVPFKGSFAGVVTITSDTSTTRCGDVDGTGIATHLGLFTVTIPHCLTKATKSTIGSYYFIAANGDTLSANFSGQASLTSTRGVLFEVEISGGRSIGMAYFPPSFFVGWSSTRTSSSCARRRA